jgi:hypothetical protein
MVRRNLVVLLLLLLSYNSMGQNKAVLLQNLWHNDLNNYTPQDFLDKVYDALKKKLLVTDFVAEPKSLIASQKNENWDKNIKEQIKAKKLTGDAYFIALATELRLPALNLGKFLFKNPPRSSKLTFTLHVYDSSGTEVLADTIINRGCVVKTVDEEKGSKYFYSDYNNFMSDMLCHLAYIRKVLQEKPLVKKQRRYLEAK